MNEQELQEYLNNLGVDKLEFDIQGKLRVIKGKTTPNNLRRNNNKGDDKDENRNK